MGRPENDFESSVDAAYPALVRAASILCWSGMDVEDVVQEALLQALRSHHSFKGTSSFLTWCYAILARVAAAANGRRRRQIPNAYLDGRPTGLPPSDAGLVEADETRRLIDAIRCLPQRQREMITLHFLHELSYAEVSAALGVAVGTVKATLYAAKNSLRFALSDAAPEGNRGEHVMP